MKEESNKKSIIKLVSVIVVFLIFAIILVVVAKKKENNDDKILDDFYKMLNSRSYGLIYLGQSTCSSCESFDKVLEEVKTLGNINYIKIDLDKLLTANAQEIVERVDMDGNTPYLAIVKEGQVVESFNYVLQGELLEKLKTYNLLDESADFGINYLNLSSVMNLIESGETKVLAISSFDDEYTKTTIFKNSLKEIAKENNVDINYFELFFESEEEELSFFNSLSLTLDQEIPAIMIIKDKEIINIISTVSKTELLEFLKAERIIR